MWQQLKVDTADREELDTTDSVLVLTILANTVFIGIRQ